MILSDFLWLDESVNVTTAQLLLFIQEANAEFAITEELDFMHSLYETTRGKNILKAAEKTLIQYNLTWNLLIYVTTNGNKSICEGEKGLDRKSTKFVKISGV